MWHRSFVPPNLLVIEIVAEGADNRRGQLRTLFDIVGRAVVRRSERKIAVVNVAIADIRI
jgi:hypothetical protein